MEKKFEDDDEIEIDLLELFYALRHRWWAILLALVIGAGAAGVYTKKLIAPHYQSTSMVYVLSKETFITIAAANTGTIVEMISATIITRHRISFHRL